MYEISTYCVGSKRPPCSMALSSLSRKAMPTSLRSSSGKSRSAISRMNWSSRSAACISQRTCSLIHCGVAETISMPSSHAGESSAICTISLSDTIENDLERYPKAYSRMEAMTSAGVLSSARMIMRVCGRTLRILRRKATSSRPEVCLPVMTRSKERDLARAKASSLPEAFCSRHPSGLRMLARADSTSGSEPMRSAVRGEDLFFGEKLAVMGPRARPVPHELRAGFSRFIVSSSAAERALNLVESSAPLKPASAGEIVEQDTSNGLAMQPCIIHPLMSGLFARRTSWNLSPNRYTSALDAHRRAGREVFDLTASNPTTIGLRYREEELLAALSSREALIYEPEPKGLLSARAAIAAYYAERGSCVSFDDLILTTSTSEAYSFVFRLLCDPGDALLAPTPSYPLFDFLADLQDVKLVPYELVYDHGWQIDFHSLHAAIERTRAAGEICRAVLVVHPNNPTGSYVRPREAEELNRICADNEMAIIADEVFLDYSLGTEPPPTFSSNCDALTFTLSGLSKISGLPQMKVAWIVVGGPETLKAAALPRLEVISDTYLSMNAPVQWAVPTMLDERHGIRRQLMYRIRGNLAELDSQLAAQKLSHRLEIEGGWYGVLRVPVNGSDEDLAIALLRGTGVLVQPGHFYDFPAEGYLVLSLITEPQIFQNGISRMLQFIATDCGY